VCVADKIKPRKLNNRVQLKINNIRNRRLQLKAIKEQKKKNEKNPNKRETIQMTDAVLTKNVRTGSYENDLNNIKLNCTSHSNNTSIEINEEYSSDRNPIKDSQELLQWLLYPVDIETFFE